MTVFLVLSFVESQIQALNTTELQIPPSGKTERFRYLNWLSMSYFTLF